MQYTDTYNEIILSFANNIHTTEGGMHETGFKTALTRVLNDYGKRHNYLKGEEKLSGEDAREGLTAIISVKLTEAQFEGQTKTKLGNSEIRTLVDNLVAEKLGAYLEKPAAAKAIIEKAIMAWARGRRAERGPNPPQNVRGLTLPESCRLQRARPCAHRAFIVEEDSRSSAIEGRDSRFRRFSLWGRC